MWQAIATEHFEGLVLETPQSLLLIASQDTVNWYHLNAHQVSVLKVCPHTPLAALSEEQLACVPELAALNAFTAPNISLHVKE
ncbi:hypothetical protein [Salinivibrio socompensis]|uniref:hypothetical protein n=1 Tax=Salinivibrio socompensis TaxID=1510206 RepID=UPI000FE14ABE|nr:hypothetical protein [Salinivibrio socompensis]